MQTKTAKLIIMDDRNHRIDCGVCRDTDSKCDTGKSLRKSAKEARALLKNGGRTVKDRIQEIAIENGQIKSKIINALETIERLDPMTDKVRFIDLRRPEDVAYVLVAVKRLANIIQNKNS